MTIQIIMNLKQSDMNYEKKYKEAMDRMELCVRSGLKITPEYIFPELAESEQKPNGGIVREDFTQGDGWYKVNLDYLSKAQVEEIEQLVEKWNPKEVSEDEKIKKAILIYLDWLDGKKDYLPKGDYTIKDMILWLEKQGEQKPEENKGNIGGISPNWSEEDGMILSCIVNNLKFIRDTLSRDAKYVVDVGSFEGQIEWLQSLKDRVQPQPKQGLREEEEAVLDALIRRLEGEDIYVSPHLAVECLKSLKERIGGKA